MSVSNAYIAPNDVAASIVTVSVLPCKLTVYDVLVSGVKSYDGLSTLTTTPVTGDASPSSPLVALASAKFSVPTLLLPNNGVYR